MKRILALVLLALCLTSCGRGYSVGERAGIVMKFSYKGLIWKSWEGYMLATVPPGAGIVAPDSFYFSVTPADTATVRKVQDAIRAGKRVRLVYSEWFFHPFTIKTRYEITDVLPTE